MKKFFVFLLVVAGIGLGVYLWWLKNDTRIITEQVRNLAGSFVQNPDSLTVTHDNIKMTGLRQARVPKLVINGANLVTKDGAKIASAKLVLFDVDIAGPPFKIAGVSSGYWQISVTDDAVTDYLHQQRGRIGGMVKIPLDTVKVFFSKKDGAILSSEVKFLNKTVPVVATGSLVPSSQLGQVDLRVKAVRVQRFSVGMKPVTDAVAKLNPLIDMSDWPVLSEVKHIDTSDGSVTVRAQVIGVQNTLLP